MSEVQDKIKSELKAFEVKKAELVESLRKEFPKMFAPLMSQFKHIETISWTQYTPYWNDGESCEFSANVDYLTINGEEEYEYEEKDKEDSKILNQIKTILNDIPEEFLEELFGDHVEVTIRKDGTIKVTKYEHD